MVQIDESLTQQVARLARLELTPEELNLFTSQLGQVIRYVEQLQQLKLDPSVEPLTHPLELATPLRDDVVRPFGEDADGQPRTLGPAPDVLDGGFKVPPIL